MKLKVSREEWPLEGTFRIARGAQTVGDFVVVTLSDGMSVGRGECEPQDHYGESVQSVIDQVESTRGPLEQGLAREELLVAMPAGAARNAVDSALWDLEAKQKSTTVWQLAGVARPQFLLTDFTVSLDTPRAMFEQASRYRDWPILKLKLAGDAHDLERVRSVREAVPGARFTVDANESWSFGHLVELAPTLAGLGVELIEQPLPAGKDDVLREYSGPVPLCADESCHTRASLDRLDELYDFVNIKLDKTGGLTEALRLARAARDRGFRLMAGCMTGTSLAMAPATVVASLCEFVDLDGALMLRNDRPHAMACHDGRLLLPTPELWG